MHGQNQGLPENSLDTGSRFEYVVGTVYFFLSWLMGWEAAFIFFSSNKLGLQRVFEDSVCLGLYEYLL